MAGFSKNPFGGGSFNPGGQSSANLFGSGSKDGSQKKAAGIFRMLNQYDSALDTNLGMSRSYLLKYRI